VFESIEESGPRARLRTLALTAGGCRLAAEAYVAVIPMVAAVPRWLFETVRAVLLAGAVVGLVGGVAVTAMALTRGERLAPAALWLALLLLAVGLCAWTWAGMTFAWRV
jgi:hypothetical protein